MKSIRSSLLAIVIFIMILNPVIGWAADSSLQDDARQVIKRTAAVLVAAQQAAQAGQIYNGLALAVAQQQAARDLYQRQQYQGAIFHSLRARGLAVRILRANNTELIPEALVDLTEEQYLNQSPSNSDLDAKVKAAGSNEAAAKVVIALDI